jgi:hypothetical protein
MLTEWPHVHDAPAEPHGETFQDALTRLYENSPLQGFDRPGIEYGMRFTAERCAEIAATFNCGVSCGSKIEAALREWAGSGE